MLCLLLGLCCSAKVQAGLQQVRQKWVHARTTCDDQGWDQSSRDVGAWNVAHPLQAGRQEQGPVNFASQGTVKPAGGKARIRLEEHCLEAAALRPHQLSTAPHIQVQPYSCYQPAKLLLLLTAEQSCGRAPAYSWRSSTAVSKLQAAHLCNGPVGLLIPGVGDTHPAGHSARRAPHNCVRQAAEDHLQGAASADQCRMGCRREGLAEHRQRSGRQQAHRGHKADRVATDRPAAAADKHSSR